MIAIRLKSGELEGLAAKALAAGAAAEVSLVAARGVADLVKDHLFALDSRSNRLGGPRSHFYSAAAKSVENPVNVGDGAAFEITKIGLAQRWLGGTIKAGAGTSSVTGGPTKYLSIPARAEAVGRAPGEFDNLKFIPTKRGGALIEAFRTLVSKVKKGFKSIGEAGGLVMFWLVTEVWQAPDPTVMPSESEMAAAAVASGESYLARRLAS
jgi:hypothetical protein